MNSDQNNSFALDIDAGLSAETKFLQSKYFYDDEGSRIFQEIMAMPEYYPTRCEEEILSKHAADLADAVAKPKMHAIELGAGDGRKILHLLRELNSRCEDALYSPIDISEEALRQVGERMQKRLPELEVQTIQGEYFEMLQRLKDSHSDRPRLVLFLGGNIGNFNQEKAGRFLRQLFDSMHIGDQLLLGVDLKKSPSIILPAYSDSHGITARFNLNLLKRINRELNADFNLKYFRHYASYSPESGEVRSYLISQKEQEVYIGALDKTFAFKAWENIHTEISRKYSEDELKMQLQDAGFKWKSAWYDSDYFFADVLCEKASG